MREETRRWWVLGGMGLSLFMVLFDETVVGVALNTIQHDLGLSPVQGHWVVNAYLLALAAFVLVGGRLGDLIGYRRTLLIGATTFGLGSLACAFAADGMLLVAFRVVQGLGAAVLFPLSMAMLMVVFPVAERGIALGWYGLIGTSGMLVGPLAGGALTEFLSWRGIFVLNVAAAAITSVIVLAAWREPPARPGGRLDVTGLALLVVALVALVLPIMQGSEWGWTAPLTLGLLGLGAVAGWLFWRVERTATDPLVDVRLFASAAFGTYAAGVFLGQLSKSAVIVFLPLYLHQVLHYTPFQAGLALTPGMAVILAVSIPFGHLIDRQGTARPLFLGLLGLAVAHTALALLVDADHYLALVLVLMVWGAATALTFQSSLIGVANSAPREIQGQAAGIANESQMLGGVFGVAAMSALQVAIGRWDVVFAFAALVAAGALLLGLLTLDRRRSRAT